MDREQLNEQSEPATAQISKLFGSQTTHYNPVLCIYMYRAVEGIARVRGDDFLYNYKQGREKAKKKTKELRSEKNGMHCNKVKAITELPRVNNHAKIWSTLVNTGTGTSENFTESDMI
jgi:hypothetical protein